MQTVRVFWHSQLMRQPNSAHYIDPLFSCMLIKSEIVGCLLVPSVLAEWFDWLKINIAHKDTSKIQTLIYTLHNCKMHKRQVIHFFKFKGLVVNGLKYFNTADSTRQKHRGNITFVRKKGRKNRHDNHQKLPLLHKPVCLKGVQRSTL